MLRTPTGAPQRAGCPTAHGHPPASIADAGPVPRAPDDAVAGASALGDLPVWDLCDLYAAPDDPALTADLAQAEREAKALAERYEGKLAGLDGDGLAGALAAYETLGTLLGRVGTYAGLRYAQNTQDTERARFMGDIQVRMTAITQATVFFSLELNRLDEAALEAGYAASPSLARYRPWLRRLRAGAPYMLSDELEKFLHDMSVVGASAWNRLFNETTSGFTFQIDGQTLGLEKVLDRLSSSERPKREAAGKALAAKLGENIKLFALITNTNAKEKEIEDRWRQYPSPDHYRHLSNDVEPEVVDALRTAVQAAYPRLSHRYYALKARWMGLEKLEYWDRNAPLPEAADRQIGWEEAKSTVLEAYGAFSPRMAELAEPFFSKGWIDAPAGGGKSPGAFAHPATTDRHPYVLLNYLGKTRDVMTLAHELGHGVHQRLAAGQGELLSSTPLTLAETASVFGEMLTFRRLLDQETDPARRKQLLAGKVEDMINTVVRQIAFYEFERRVHAARRDGELMPERLGEIWMETQRDALGPAMRLAEGYENFWAYIPHFIHAPFYVYAYAFGDGLVNALYAVYEQGEPGFQDRYFEMLSAGGSKHHKELLAPFGLDASDPAFWTHGLDLIDRFITELEGME
ncbi:MAG: M3 family oligoendopeptidase [Pseudomonadota bacterium]